MCINLSIIKCSNEQEIICRGYWKLNDAGKFEYSLSDIRSTLNLTVSNLASFVRKYSDAESETVKCVNCNTPYLYKSRRDFISHKEDFVWECGLCNTNDGRPLLRNQTPTLANFSAKEFDADNLKNLKITDKVFLMTALSGLSDEDFNCTWSADCLGNKALTPGIRLDEEIIKRLIYLGLLNLPGNLSPLSNELVELDDFLFHLETKTLEFSLPPIVLRKFLKDIDASSLKQQIVEDDGFLILCKDVCLFECISFLLLQLNSHGFHFVPGEKTAIVLSKCLEDYSVGEVYLFIWKSILNSSSYYLKENISRKHAANAVIGNIERQYERAIANKWKINGFRRNYHLPQSVLSRVIFNQILGTDDGCFKHKLSDLIPH